MTTILPFPPLDPPMLPAWSCHCGKRSVGAVCWNCRQAREVGEVDGGDNGQDQSAKASTDGTPQGNGRVLPGASDRVQSKQSACVGSRRHRERRAVSALQVLSHDSAREGWRGLTRSGGLGYNDPVSSAQGTGGEHQNSEVRQRRVEASENGRHVTRPISWAGLWTPLFRGLPTGAKASGLQIGPRNGPMALRGVFDGRS